MAFGLENSEISYLQTIFKKYENVKVVVLYGSRAKGNFTSRSDIDLVITNSTIDRFVIANILMDIDESNIPYSIDLQDYNTIKNNDLKNHINRLGIQIYKKS